MHKVASRQALDELKGKKPPLASPAVPPVLAKVPAAPPSPQVDIEARQLIRAVSKNLDRVAEMMAAQIASRPAATSETPATPAVAPTAPEQQTAQVLEIPLPKRPRLLEMPPFEHLAPTAAPAPVPAIPSKYEASIERDKNNRMSAVTIAQAGGARSLAATVHRDAAGRMARLTITVS